MSIRKKPSSGPTSSRPRSRTSTAHSKTKPAQQILGRVEQAKKTYALRLPGGPTIPLTAHEQILLNAKAHEYARKHGTPHGFFAEVFGV